jgi:peroxiredoxin Q/BCP
MMLEKGQIVDNFEIVVDNGIFKLSDYLGKKVVVYFYPKDNTPGCMKQACDFRDSITVLNTLNSVVLGVSKDSIESHVKFKERFHLNFPLGSDPEGKLAAYFGVWKEKSLFGRKYFGMVRSMFLINEVGKLQEQWIGVNVLTHISKLLKVLEENE